MRELELTQAEVRRRGGPTQNTLRELFLAADNGTTFKSIQPETQLKFDRSLGWEEGSTRDTIAGGSPRPLVEGQATVVHGPNGQDFLIPPPAIVEALKTMTSAERAEAEARMWAEAFKALREMRGA